MQADRIGISSTHLKTFRQFLNRDPTPAEHAWLAKRARIPRTAIFVLHRQLGLSHPDAPFALSAQVVLEDDSEIISCLSRSVHN